MDSYERYRLERDARHKRRANRNLTLLKALTSSKDVIDAFEALDMYAQVSVDLDEGALVSVRDALFKAVEAAKSNDRFAPPRTDDESHDEVATLVKKRFGPHTSNVRLVDSMYERTTTSVERMPLGDDDTGVTLTATEDLHVGFRVMFALETHGFTFSLTATLGIERGEDGAATYKHKDAVATENLVRHEAIGINALEHMYHDVLLALKVPADVIAALKYTWKREY